MLSPAFFHSLQREVNSLFDNFFATPFTNTFADPFVDPFAPLDNLRQRFLGLLDEFPTHYLTSGAESAPAPMDKETQAGTTPAAAPAAGTTPAAAAAAPAPAPSTAPSTETQLAQRPQQTQVQRASRMWIPRCDVEERPNEVCLVDFVLWLKTSLFLLSRRS